MRRLFRRMSLKKRLWVSFILLTVICISATGSYVSVFFSNQMKTQATKTSQDTLNKTAQVFDERLRHIVVSIYTFMMGEPFQQLMMDVQANKRSNYYNQLSRIQTSFAQMLLTEQSIESVIVHTPIGDFYPSESRRNRDVIFADTEIQKRITEAQDPWNTLWIPGHQDELFNKRSNVLSLVIRPLFDPPQPGVYVVVNIREDVLLDMIQANLQEGSLRQFLVDRSGRPVFSSSSILEEADRLLYEQIESSDKGHFEYTFHDGTHYMINYKALEMNPGWVLIGYQSKSELLAPVRHMNWTLLTIMGICIALALVISSMLSGLLLKPLYKLRSLMLKVEQNHLNVRFESVFEDEISQVGHRFNRMLEQIGELIEEVKLSEREKRKSEIKALQAQIDPHFLYNTLNTIYWKSQLEEHKEVSEMIVSLSLLFRLGLNNGQEITTLQQELDHVTQYLNLQAMCYPDLFQYELVLSDDQLLKVPVLKILLQPLVENAILHGFQGLSRQGCIRIEVQASAGMLIMTVSDNGCGMTEALVERVLNDQDRVRSSYALSNVRTRLSLYYDNKASIKISSKVNVGTSVQITIPLARGEDDERD